MKATVIGAQGFIGRHLVKLLESKGYEIYAPLRDDPQLLTSSLGNVFYCAGVTSDFRKRPFDTVKAHVGDLRLLLEHADFNTFLYLSSTRVYSNQPQDKIVREEDLLRVNPLHPEDLFNLSKLAGESLCLTVERPNVKVARISNVCGADFESNNFLYSIIKDAINHREIVLRSSLESEKDYISVNDVTSLLLQISKMGVQRIYNVASGRNISHEKWVEHLKKYTGCRVTVIPDAKVQKFPPISIERIQSEFNYVPTNCLSMAQCLVEYYVKEKK
ncbi:NAD-dependent epimerase/dehydratase family protein [Paenibacillus tianmuensis]|uniref:NAD-dependent epimerase/dehydratase family protein n=1 Tax=Paenibacillus tianmuensis TaxID=624147 RepID=UPI0014319179|nr:NAD(P)-dependent oxidoreductase [Paenibacillus tianmuensis]